MPKLIKKHLHTNLGDYECLYGYLDHCTDHKPLTMILGPQRGLPQHPGCNDMQYFGEGIATRGQVL